MIINIIKMNDLGFVIVRHVNSVETNEYWKENIIQIRKFYPTNIIMIVDDNSDVQYLNNNGVNLMNCFIIQSEYEKRGELLGYYYFYKYKLFNKAVILHDSVFIQKYIDFGEVEKVKFLWTFQHKFNIPENEKIFIHTLNNNSELFEIHRDLNRWSGSFGVMSIIEHDFLKNLQDKYSFFNLIEFIKTREERSCLERVFGLLCFAENPNLLNMNNCSLFGDIHKYMRWGLSFQNYLEYKQQYSHFPIIKVWTGR